MTSWIENSEERLTANFRAIQQAVGDQTAVLAVVKANAYGHGIEQCSLTLARAGAPWLGVNGVSEGAQVRRALAETGLAPAAQPAILLMCGFLPEDVEAIAQHTLTPVVWIPEQVGWLQGTGLAVHIEVDTGMARQGVTPGVEMDELLGEIAAAGLTLDGVMTHFCAAEVAHSALTQTQERRFEAAIAQVRSKGLAPRWVHAGSSSSVDNPAQASPWLVDLANSVGARAMVRCGCALYGYCVPIDGPAASSAQSKLRAFLKPVMTWKTRIVGVRDVPIGTVVGYNATFVATEPMRLALIAAGYADGLDRRLGNRFHLLVRGEQAPLVGRVSMDQAVIDVTNIPEAKPGDEVILIGAQGTETISAADHAAVAGTIPYQIFTSIGPRVPRIAVPPVS